MCAVKILAMTEVTECFTGTEEFTFKIARSCGAGCW